MYVTGAACLLASVVCFLQGWLPAALIIFILGIYLFDVALFGPPIGRTERAKQRPEGSGERKPPDRRGPRGEPEPDPPPPAPPLPDPPPAAAFAIEEREDEAEATVSAIASRSADGRPLEPHAPPAAPVGHAPAAGASERKGERGLRPVRAGARPPAGAGRAGRLVGRNPRSEVEAVAVSAVQTSR